MNRFELINFNPVMYKEKLSTFGQNVLDNMLKQSKQGKVKEQKEYGKKTDLKSIKNLAIIG